MSAEPVDPLLGRPLTPPERAALNELWRSLEALRRELEACRRDREARSAAQDGRMPAEASDVARRLAAYRAGA